MEAVALVCTCCDRRKPWAFSIDSITWQGCGDSVTPSWVEPPMGHAVIGTPIWNSKMNRSYTKPGFRLVAFSRGKGLSYFSGSRDIWLLGTVGTSKTRPSNCILLVVLYVAPLEAWRSFAGVPFLYVSCCLRIRLEIHGNIPARQKSTWPLFSRSDGQMDLQKLYIFVDAH